MNSELASYSVSTPMKNNKNEWKKRTEATHNTISINGCMRKKQLGKVEEEKQQKSHANKFKRNLNLA